jgi:hypothetical protein
MAVEQTDGGMVVTGEHIAVFQLLRVGHALALEINTGMKVAGGRSVMQLAAGYCGSTKRTKKGVLRDYIAFLAENLPHTADGAYQPSPSIQRALGK